MGNNSIYSVSKEMVYQIWQNSKTECFPNISREGLTREILAKTSCHHLSWLFVFQSCVEHMASLRGKSSRELPAKTPLIFNLSWVFTLSLTHNPYNEIPHKIQGTYDWTKLQSNLARNYSQYKIVVNHNFTRSFKAILYKQFLSRT